MFIKETVVDQEVSNYLERLSREVEGAKEIIAFMLENDKGINTESFKQYKAEYNEAKAAFDIAKEDAQKRFVPAALIDQDAANTSWTLDYATNTVKVTYNGKKFTEEQFNALFE